MYSLTRHKHIKTADVSTDRMTHVFHNNGSAAVRIYTLQFFRKLYIQQYYEILCVRWRSQRAQNVPKQHGLSKHINNFIHHK